MKHRSPNQTQRFCWARIPGEHVCTWRLFRRSSITGRAFLAAVSLPAGMSRTSIAGQLRKLRNGLRDKVDAFDLEKMGVAA